MNKTVLLTAGAALLSFTSFAEARKHSSEAELYGYNQCVSAAKKESNGLVPSRHYFINKSQANAEYFVNASRWEQGERAAVRVTCETTKRGQLISHRIDEGFFTNSTGRVTVELAQN